MSPGVNTVHFLIRIRRLVMAFQVSEREVDMEDFIYINSYEISYLYKVIKSLINGRFAFCVLINIVQKA